MGETLGPYPLNSIITGDARQLAPAIPDNSVDLIFTDPPYGKKYLLLYSWLAEFAHRVLKPNGFCLAMCGGLYLNQVLRSMDCHLDFFWLYDIRLIGWAASLIWPYGNQRVNIISRVRRVVAYCKGAGLPRTSTLTLFDGKGADKRYHAWGQDETSTRYYVDCFSDVGDLVVDPFCGGGTTPAMCRVLRRSYVAFEIDSEVAEIAQKRVCEIQPLLFLPPTEQLQIPL